MKKYTEKDLETFERDENGFLICPSGDYTAIRLFFVKCFFGNKCSFGWRSIFRDECIFGENCRFDKNCKFDMKCSFGAGCSFGDECRFVGCSFGAGCSFGDECRDRENQKNIKRSRINTIKLNLIKDGGLKKCIVIF